MAVKPAQKQNIKLEDLNWIISRRNGARVLYLKRGFDILLAMCTLTLGLPIFTILAILTKITSKGPIFYLQERIGQNGKPFIIYKFRSMYANAEETEPKLSDGNLDTRITPWGQFIRKFRLDELPQFYNVLIGNMSVVGPRPERQFYIDQIMNIAPEYGILLGIKPGTTSIGQVTCGYASTVTKMVERLRYDLVYLEYQSFLLDLWIVGQTVRVVLEGRGQ